MNQRDKYIEWVDGLVDSVESKKRMLKFDGCYIEWLENELDEKDTEIERINTAYISAVKGRSDFRNAIRESRKKEDRKR